MMKYKSLDVPIKVEIYKELAEWEVNLGTQDNTITAKRMSGRFRTLKYLGMSVWSFYFLMPYVRWNGSQAILFDLPRQQFNFFNVSLYPQDIWMLSLSLLFLAILLAAVTSIAGRVFCGYFCFQTVWTDVFTLIEAKLEGNTPQKAHQFRTSPWTLSKLSKKLTKHATWLTISIVTGISFSAWFMDAFELWKQIIHLSAPKPVWLALAIFGLFTYWFAGFMREQVCFWLCPYARLQGVMYDQDTVLPAYDAQRGEPRGKLNKGEQDEDAQGSCIDCKVCVAVCPTGIDIRKGQQEGCITCGLCIDACDSIMDQIDQPRGLIRYASYKELHQGAETSTWYLRSRFIVYSSIMLAALAGIAYGFSHLPPTEFNVIHSRQPLYILLSDGSIQNKYTLKLLNKTKKPMVVNYQIAGLSFAELTGSPETVVIEPGKIVAVTAYVKMAEKKLISGLQDIKFIANIVSDNTTKTHYDSVFISP
jgi:cytochrome c oxidase accessory protein FixG